jgi:hypothetical protein
MVVLIIYSGISNVDPRDVVPLEKRDVLEQANKKKPSIDLLSFVFSVASPRGFEPLLPA